MKIGRASAWLVFFLVWTFLTGACGVDLAIPEGAEISCDSDQQCPELFKCDTAAGRCIPLDRDDLVGPRILSASIEATPGAPLGPFVVTFEVDETLRVQPVVYFETVSAAGPVRRSFSGETLPLESSRTFQVSYQAQGDEGDGEYPLSVVLEDTSGNRSTSWLGISIPLDFTAPWLVGGGANVLLEQGAIVDAACDLYPIPQVGALTTCSAATVTFVVSEPLSDVSLIFHEGGVDHTDHGLTVSPADVDGVAVSFSVTVPAGASVADRVYELAATAQDAAGNSARLQLGTLLEIDTTPPALPPVADTQAAPSPVVFIRKPWGEASDPGERYALSGTLSPGHGAHWVVAYARADATGEIGRFDVTNDAGGIGTFGGALDMVDRVQLFLVTVDAAGNRSDADPLASGIQASLVERVAWSATLLGKIAGSSFENPHHFETRKHFAAEGETVVEGVVEMPSLLSAGDLEATSGAATWQRVATGVLPGRAGPGFAFDYARRQLLFFGGGGWGATAVGPDTYQRAAGGWTQIALSDPELDGNPSASFARGMTYAAVAGGIVLFPRDGITWVFNGSSWRAARSVQTPPAVANRAMVYDRESRRLLLVQSSSSFSPVSQTWSWDGREWRMEEGSCAEALPELSAGFQMLYQGAAARSLLFNNGEIWEWQEGCWSRLPCPEACGGPTVGRAGYDVVYDASRDVVVLHGGIDVGGVNTCLPGGVGSGCAMIDTWEWNGAWRCASGTIACDPAVHGCPLDAGGAEMTVVDRCGAGVDYDLYKGVVMVAPGDQLPPVSGPVGRAGGRLAFDPDAAGGGAVYLIGGDQAGAVPGPSTPPSDELWQWDGTTWTLQQPAALPPAAYASRMATHPGAGLTLMVSDATNDTWLWNGERWQNGCSGGCQRPTAAAEAVAMTYDPTSDRILYVGRGAGISQTWEWDPNRAPEWQMVCDGAGMCATQPEVSVWDAWAAPSATLGGVVLFRRGNPVAAVPYELWHWNLGVWSQICTDTACIDSSPSNVSSGILTSDPASGGVLWHTTGGIWLFDGLVWSQLTSSGKDTPALFDAGGGYTLQPNPTTRTAQLWNGSASLSLSIDAPTGIAPDPSLEGFSIASDPLSADAILFGGVVTVVESDMLIPVPQSATWRLRSSAGAYPAHVVTVTFDAARSPNAEIRGIDILWEGDSGDGAVLFWIADFDRWLPVTPTASTSALGLRADWQSEVDAAWAGVDSAGWAAKMFGAQQELRVAVSPSLPNGDGIAQLTTGRFEVTVVYAQR